MACEDKSLKCCHKDKINKPLLRNEDEMLRNEDEISSSENNNDYTYKQKFCKDYLSGGYRWVF